MQAVGRLQGCPTSVTASSRESEVNYDGSGVAFGFDDAMRIHVLERVLSRALSVFFAIGAIEKATR